MFLAIREIRYAKGRFTLICGVIALMTFMVVALSALTAGLTEQSISAIKRLPGTSLVLQDGAGTTPVLTQSALDDRAVAAIGGQAGAGAASLGVSTQLAEFDGRRSAVAVFGADPRLMPSTTAGTPPGPDGIVLTPQQADDLDVRIGDRITLGDRPLRVDGLAHAGSFAHTPAAYTTLDTWRAVAHGQDVNAVVLLSGHSSVPGTTTLPMSQAKSTVPGYGSEHGSLLAMQVLLLAISALVVGAFFAVWTVQRLRDLAIVRAMGAARGYLLRDGLGQALLVLAAGEIVGALVAVALVALLPGIVPLSLTAGAGALPVVAMTVLGVLGGALAVRRVTTVDPLTALAA